MIAELIPKVFLLLKLFESLVLFENVILNCGRQNNATPNQPNVHQGGKRDFSGKIRVKSLEMKRLSGWGQPNRYYLKAGNVSQLQSESDAKEKDLRLRMWREVATAKEYGRLWKLGDLSE